MDYDGGCTASSVYMPVGQIQAQLGRYEAGCYEGGCSAGSAYTPALASRIETEYTPAAVAELGTQYAANEDVIIYSESQGGWVPARIVSVQSDDSVTVQYTRTGHTKMVPLEFQKTHLRPTNEPPPEPAPMFEPTPASSLLPMPSLLGNGFQLPQLPQLPQLASFAVGSSALGQPELGPVPSSFNQGGGPPAPVEVRVANTKYSMGQKVTIYSESSKAWVLGKITDVMPDGMVTVLYGANQKSVPVEKQKTHLAELHPNSKTPTVSATPTAAAAPAAATPSQLPRTYSYTAVAAPAAAPAAAAYTAVAAPAAAPAAASSLLGQAKFDFFATPGCGNFGAPPPEQVGTFQYDLSQLCNEAQPGMGHAPVGCNAQGSPYAPAQFAW